MAGLLRLRLFAAVLLGETIVCGSEFVERGGHLRCGCGRVLDYLLCGGKCIRICLPRISRVVILVELLTLNSGDLVSKRLALLIGAGGTGASA